MEDFPNEDQVEDQEDKKKKKKRRLPTFLTSWLGRENDESREAKKPFSGRAWKVFQKLFSGEAERPEKLKDSNTTTEERPAFLDFTGVETKQTNPETTTVPEKTELTQKAERAEPEPEQPAEGGELIIEHREEEDEDWRANAEEILAYELPPEVEPPILPIQRQVELAQEYDVELASAASASQPEKLGDLLERRQKQTEKDLAREKQRNRKHNRHLKKQVSDLKHEAKSASKQNKTLKKEQIELEMKVERLNIQPEVTQLIAHQERERAELRMNRGMAARPEVRAPEQSKPVPQLERVPVYVPEAQPRRPETTQRYEAPRPQEPIVQQFEPMPQENTRSERDFERRHEVKDEAGSPQAAAYSAMASADAAYRAAAAQIGQVTASRSHQTPSPLTPAAQPALQTSNLMDSPMYRQAMRNGFLTAIILLAVWFVISLLS